MKPSCARLQLMKKIRHPNLIGLSGAWQRDGVLIIAMELGDGTLMNRLHEAQRQGLPGIPAGELLEYMRDAARGLEYLHLQPDSASRHQAAQPPHRGRRRQGGRLRPGQAAATPGHDQQRHPDPRLRRPRVLLRPDRDTVGPVRPGGHLLPAARRPFAILRHPGRDDPRPPRGQAGPVHAARAGTAGRGPAMAKGPANAGRTAPRSSPPWPPPLARRGRGGTRKLRALPQSDRHPSAGQTADHPGCWCS